MNQKIFFLNFFLLSLILTAPLGALEPELLSDEMVPIILSQGALKCSDAIRHRHGFQGPEPGLLALSESDIFDRTLRVRNVFLSFELPDSVDCASLALGLSQVPRDISARRKVYRTIHSNLDAPTTSSSSLISDIELEIPVQINEQNIVLRGQDSWLEENPARASSFPKKDFYAAHTHPQSASYPVGLFCKPLYSGSEKYELSLGKISGYGHANLDIVARTFPNQQQCEETRSDLFKRYQAEDPENWGSLIRVQRDLEARYRYILDNNAQSQCQEIQLETLSITLQGLKYSGALASFPIKTVDLSLCSSSDLLSE